MVHLAILICLRPNLHPSQRPRLPPMPALYATHPACLAAGLATLAATRIGRDVGKDEVLRVACR